MNRGVFAGLKSIFIPEWAGGGDPANDGALLGYDTTQPGGVKPVSSGTYAPAAQSLAASPFQQIGNWFMPALGAQVNRALSLNDAWAAPVFIGATMTVDQLAILVNAVGAASSVCRLGIYSDSNGYPGTLVVDAGTVNTVASTGVKTITGLSAALQPGLYWVVVVAQVASGPTLSAGFGGAVQFGGTFNQPGGGLSASGGLYFIGGSITGALPGTYPVGANVGGNVPYVGLHRSA